MTDTIISFGEWAQQRREFLGLTRIKLANLVGCSPITIKKIERDERRPSVQIGNLLALHLRIPTDHKNEFMRKARGEYLDRFIPPTIEDDSQSKTELPKPDRYTVLPRLEILPDQKLFGIQSNKKTLVEVLEQEKRPWLLSIEGLGGLGKTTITNEIVHHFLDSTRFQDIGWISAKQEEYVAGVGIQSINRPALTAESLVDLLLVQLSDTPTPIVNNMEKRTALLRLLKEKKCLIVIDNLETVEDYLTLIPLLRQLAQPSKFVITSRMSLKNESDVYCLNLSELDEETTLSFLKYEAQNQNIASLLKADDGLLKRIYRTTGGNPLAIKLVIGQSNFLPLEQILNNLQQSQEIRVEQLYNYIYWQAWQMLDDNGRKLFISLPIVPNGSFEQLKVASNLSDIELQHALLKLQQLSLIKVKGDLSNPRYGIHRLTESFLMKEVIRWQAEDQDQSQKEVEFFTSQIQAIVSHWQDDKNVQELNVPELEAEKEAILKALYLGLDIKQAWPMVKDLLASLSGYMERRGYWDTWQTFLSNAIRKARSYQDLEGELSLTTLKGRVSQRQQNIPEVIRSYRNVIRLARKANNPIEEGRACSNLGFSFTKQRKWYRSKVLLCHALDLFNETDFEHGKAHTHNHLGILYHDMKLWDDAEKHYKMACEIWEQSNDHHGLLYGLENLGAISNDMNKPEQSIKYLTKALQLAETTGEVGELAAINLNLGIAFEISDKLEKAEQYITQAESQYKNLGYLLGIYISWEYLGKIYQKKDDKDLAENYFESALEGFIDIDNEAGRLRIDALISELKNISHPEY